MKKLRGLLLAGAVLAPLAAFAGSGPQPGVGSPWNTVWDIPVDSIKWSYSLGFNLSPSVGAQDVFTLCGDPLSQNVVRVTRIAVSGRATAAASVPIFIIKRAGNTTGGLFSVEAPFLSSTTTGVPMDTANQIPGRAFATAWTTTTQPLQPTYTLGPAASGNGGGNGLLASQQLFLGNLTTGQAGPTTIFDWGVRPSQEPVLRGSNQCLAVNLSNSTNAGNLLNFEVEWTEE